LQSSSPIQNLSVGNEPSSVSPRPNGELQQPQHEIAYLKILNQLFGDRLYIANQLKENHAGISANVAASPEYGFGSLLARIEHRKRFAQEVQDAAESGDFITDSPKSWLSKWVLTADDPAKVNSIASEVITRLSTDGSRLATHLLSSKADWLGCLGLRLW
jgi:sulfite reductase (NADPH) hemoprotein beta-component